MSEKPNEHDRRKFIGGSDTASILGLSPWKTPLQLYEEKISEAPPPALAPEREKFFARRKRQEPVVAEMLADEYGIETTRVSLDGNPNRYRDQQLPYLAAEIDFEFKMTARVRRAFGEHQEFAAIPDGTVINGEIKTVNAFRSAEWTDNEGNPDLPIYYATQGMHGLGVTRRPATIVAALIGIDALVAFPLMADADTIAGMRARCQIFWRHVSERVPPAPSNIDELKALYKQFRGTRVELDDQAYALFERRFQLKDEEDRTKAALESVEFQLAEYIAKAWGTPAETNAYDGPEYERAILVRDGHQVGSWNRQAGAYLDQKSLKSAFPDIVKAYTIQHHYRVLRRKAIPK